MSTLIDTPIKIRIFLEYANFIRIFIIMEDKIIKFLKANDIDHTLFEIYGYITKVSTVNVGLSIIEYFDIEEYDKLNSERNRGESIRCVIGSPEINYEIAIRGLDSRKLISFSYMRQYEYKSDVPLNNDIKTIKQFKNKICNKIKLKEFLK